MIDFTLEIVEYVGCFVLIPDFVDALSAPMQFTSAAEKRAKQMQGLGFEEKDISDVSVPVEVKAVVVSAQSQPKRGIQKDDSTMTSSIGSHQTSMAHQDSVTEKDKKG